MTLAFILPKLVLWMFVSNRKTWLYKVRVAPERAFELFSDLMTGATAGRTQKAATYLGTRGMKWGTERTDDGVAATCLGGMPARVFYRGGSVRIEPDGQVIEFEHVAANPPQHTYELVPSNLTTYGGLLAFGGSIRYYFHRTARILKRDGGDIEVTYPISWFKLALWLGLVVIVIAVASG